MKRYAEVQHNNPSKRSKIEEVDPEEIKSSYQDLINQHKQLVPLKKELLRYQEILNEELQRQESDPNHILDQQKIKQAAGFLKKIKVTTLRNTGLDSVGEKIQKEFPQAFLNAKDEDLKVFLREKLGVLDEDLKVFYEDELSLTTSNDDKSLGNGIKHSKIQEYNYWYSAEEINNLLTKSLKEQAQEHVMAAAIWYNDEEINNLLTKSLKEQAQEQVMAAAIEYDDLRNRIKAGKEHLNQEIGSISIPINLNGVHWVALVIKQYPIGKWQVIYNDPKEIPISKKLREILKKELDENINIIDLQVKQQNNDNDCGPFTVDNIIKLVGTDTHNLKEEEIKGLLSVPATGNAEHLRREHAVTISMLEYNLPKLPELTSSMDIVDEDIKSLDTLQEEILLLDVKEKQRLNEAYKKIKAFYEGWKNKQALEIRDWAESKKGSLKEEEQFEAIAVMDRANELATGGHQLRDTQTLALLSFLQAKEGYGRLCQISTGEGKTTIVALLAALKVLQGENVDIITSNEVLAAEGVKDKQNFYQLLGINACHNNVDPGYISGQRECYKSDILYGSIGNFQFDYLRDEFEEHGTRGERKFSTVILDEVDNMLIDNGEYIAKLSPPFPGMDSLRYIHIKIWQELHKAEDSLNLEFQKKLKDKAEENALRVKNKEIDDETAQNEYRALEKNLSDIIKLISEKIKESNPKNIGLLPKHVKAYADRMLDTWIANAIHAKYTYHENEHYIIKKKTRTENEGEQNQEEIVIPVDYANTGVTMQNTIWSYGLHQFIQLKHNLQITPESLTSSFISNLGYIKKYGNKIFGLTGTLGSESEQKLLSSIYKIDYAVIPTFKKKKFEEHAGKIVRDNEWSAVVAIDTLAKVKEGRAVLIICQTINDLNTIRQWLEILKKGEEITYNIKEYADECNSHIVEEELKPGDIVIATNIAGRGTDLKTSQELEENGGLHVCVSFLPCNKRVEEQAFGRTARQGKNGSAELIIRANEVQAPGFNLEENQIDKISLEEVKKSRDKLEQHRIKEIQEKKIGEIDFQDQLFECFCKRYKELKLGNKDIKYRLFVLNDLKEFWAFWLEEHVLSQNLDTKSKKPEDLFKEFEEKAQPIIKGEINHNPYYNIQLAEYYLAERNILSRDNIQKAKEVLKKAMEMDTNPAILYSAYIKQFEVAMEEGEVLLERFKDAMAKVAFFKKNIIKNAQYKDNDAQYKDNDAQYKDNAKEALQNAKSALQKEIEYIQTHFFADNAEHIKDFHRILIPIFDIEKSSKKMQDISTMDKKENLLIKHLKSRLICLETHYNSIESLLASLTSTDNTDKGLAINSRIPNYLTTFKPINDQEKKLKDSISNSELIDLKQIGLDTIYALREVHNVPKETIVGAQAQIITGVGLLTSSIFFPPSAIVTVPLANTMISEGLCDIIIELISQGNAGFDAKAYAKSKAISYGISLATMGFSVAITCTKLLDKAVKSCKSLSQFLQKSDYMINLCTTIADKVDKLGQSLEKISAVNKLSKLSKIQQIEYLETLQKVGNFQKLKQLGGIEKLQVLKQAQELTKLQGFGQALKGITCSSLQGVAMSVFMEKVVTASLSRAMEELKSKIREKILDEIKNKIDSNKLRLVEPQYVFEALSEAMTGSATKIIGDITKEIALGVARHSGNWKMQLITLMIDSILSGIEISKCAKEICQELNSKLTSLSSKQEQNQTIVNNAADEIINKIAEQITELIYGKVVGLTGKIITTAPKVAYGAYKEYQDKQKLSEYKKEQDKKYAEAEQQWKQNQLEEETSRLQNMTDGVREYNKYQIKNKPFPATDNQMQDANPLDFAETKALVSYMKLGVEITYEEGGEQKIFRNKEVGAKDINYSLSYKKGDNGVGHVELIDKTTGEKVPIQCSGNNTCIIDALARLSDKDPKEVYGMLLHLHDKGKKWWVTEYATEIASLMDKVSQGRISYEEFRERYIEINNCHLVSGQRTILVKHVDKEAVIKLKDEKISDLLKKHINERTDNFLKIMKFALLLKKLNPFTKIEPEEAAQLQLVQGLHKREVEGAVDTSSSKKAGDISNIKLSQCSHIDEAHTVGIHLTGLEDTTCNSSKRKADKLEKQVVTPPHKRVKTESKEPLESKNTTENTKYNSSKRKADKLEKQGVISPHKRVKTESEETPESKNTTEDTTIVVKEQLIRMIANTNKLPKCVNIGADKIIDAAQFKQAREILTSGFSEHTIKSYITECLKGIRAKLKTNLPKDEKNILEIYQETLEKQLDNVSYINDKLTEYMMQEKQDFSDTGYEWYTTEKVMGDCNNDSDV